MILSEEIKNIVIEELNNLDKIYYHGTRTPLPFQNFDPKLIGTGLVSSGQKEYGGFFFTSEKENAEFYTEYFVASVKIANLIPNPTTSSHPPTVMQIASKEQKNYVVNEVLDGAVYSDIAVVPSSNVKDIQIISWEFIGDTESYFEHLDRIFGSGEEDDFVNKDMIIDTIRMIELDPNYLLKIPVIKQYYDSKS